MNDNLNEFDIKSIFTIIYNNLIKIILVALIFGSASFGITKYYIPKVYEASAKMIVNRDSNSKDQEITPFSYSDALLTAKLTETYSIILTSDTLLSKVISQLNIQLTPEALRGKITASGVKDTDVLSISVKDNDPQTAANIVNKILELAPEQIITTVKAGSVATIDTAKVPISPIQPNVPINTLIALFLGAAIVIAFELLKEYLDDTVKSDEQIKQRFGIPVLGMLPEVDGVEEKTNE